MIPCQILIVQMMLPDMCVSGANNERDNTCTCACVSIAHKRDCPMSSRAIVDVTAGDQDDGGRETIQWVRLWGAGYSIYI